MKTSTYEKYLFEESPVSEAVLKLAIPSVIGQIIMVIYNLADTFFVGMAGSDIKLTAVSICMPGFMILTAISNLFGVGGSSLISRSLGKSRHAHAELTSSFAFYGCLSISFLYCFFAFLFMNPLVDAIGGTQPQVHELAKKYLFYTVIIGGIPTSMGALFAHLIRSEGRSSAASKGVVLGGVLNMFLDPLFMFVILPKGMEVTGAALATMLSNMISCIYFCAVIRQNKEKSILQFRLTPRALMDNIPKDVISVGTPACLMTLFENISFAVLDKIISFSGVEMQTGIGVAKKVNMLAHSIARGMSQGVLPIIAYNYASGDHNRMKKILGRSESMIVGSAAGCMFICLFFSNNLIGIFINSESNALSCGADFLKILCIGGPFSAAAYGLISFFQATGHGKRSLMLALMRKGILDIPMMFILHKTFGPYGASSATPIADMICCLAAIIIFRQFARNNLNSSENEELDIL